jgi:hypothetical protein
MKFVLAILFIAIFSIACMAQDDIIGVPLIIKKGETQKSGRLQIKYLGSLEVKTVLGSDKNEAVGIGLFNYHFEVTDAGKKYEFKETSSFNVNGLVVEILEKLADSDAVKIVVLTEEMFGRKVLQKIENWQADYEANKNERKKRLDELNQFSQGYPIYANISIKRSVAEFSFFVMHREKNEGDEFAEVLFKRIAVTNPTLNKSEMKMIPKKIGIVYRVKVKEAKQKYTVSFTHLGNEYEGVIELNPTVTRELKQIEFYRKVDEKL